MSVKEILQGKWLGHPLHPALVHLPTGLWPMALLFDVLSICGVGGNAMVKASFWSIALGLGAAVLAIGPGVADWMEIKPEKPAHKLGIYHMSLNAVVAVMFIINLSLRYPDFRTAGAVTISQMAMTAVATAILMFSGYLGGRMVYSHGTGIARYSKKKWRRIAEAAGAHLPEEK